jgi:hypothetical protein
MRFSVIVIHGAAPGRFAHHPGVTSEGVICGHRDNSAIARKPARGPPAGSGVLYEGAHTARARLSQDIEHGKVVPPGIAGTDPQQAGQ